MASHMKPIQLLSALLSSVLVSLFLLLAGSVVGLFGVNNAYAATTPYALYHCDDNGNLSFRLNCTYSVPNESGNSFTGGNYSRGTFIESNGNINITSQDAVFNFDRIQYEGASKHNFLIPPIRTTNLKGNALLIFMSNSYGCTPYESDYATSGFKVCTKNSSGQYVLKKNYLGFYMYSSYSDKGYIFAPYFELIPQTLDYSSRFDTLQTSFQQLAQLTSTTNSEITYLNSSLINKMNEVDGHNTQGLNNVKSSVDSVNTTVARIGNNLNTTIVNQENNTRTTITQDGNNTRTTITDTTERQTATLVDTSASSQIDGNMSTSASSLMDTSILGMAVSLFQALGNIFPTSADVQPYVAFPGIPNPITGGYLVPPQNVYLFEYLGSFYTPYTLVRDLISTILAALCCYHIYKSVTKALGFNTDTSFDGIMDELAS